MVSKPVGMKEQEVAEEIGLTEKSERRIKDIGKPELLDDPVLNVPIKTEAHCTVDGCNELKASGQTHVCTQHMRSN